MAAPDSSASRSGGAAPGSGDQLWDPVVRILHWALVLAFAAAWGLGKFGPAQMTLHFYAGYSVAVIVALRVIWGFAGPATARFASFLRGPGAILRYAATLPERRPSGTWGHNPVGALFVVGVLAVLAMQVVSGLLSDPEDYINVGPLAHLVSYETTQAALALHEPLSTLLLVMVGLHVAAILFYRKWKGEDLVTPMITGRRR